jgi:hypothetical protein
MRIDETSGSADILSNFVTGADTARNLVIQGGAGSLLILGSNGTQTVEDNYTTSAFHPVTAGSRSLGYSARPWTDVTIGPSASLSFHFDTSALTSLTRAVKIPDVAVSNPVVPQASATAGQFVTNISNDGVQHLAAGGAIRAGTWSISAATTVAVTFATAFGATPTSCQVTPSASAATTGVPFATALSTTGFTVNVPTSGTLSGTYLCAINNTN